MSTVVLEAALAARGSTSLSSALLLQEPDLGLSELQERYGARTSQRIWQTTRSAVTSLVALLARLRIGCQLRKRDTIYYATTIDAARRLTRELKFRTKAGFDGEWLGAGELRRRTAIPGRGAIQTRGNAQFDPYRACVGVLRAAVASGAHVFERSRVTRISCQRHGVRVTTERGAIDARRVIVATGYATRHFDRWQDASGCTGRTC